MGNKLKNNKSVMLRLVRSIELMINIPSLRGLKACGNQFRHCEERSDEAISLYSSLLPNAFRDCFASRRAFSLAMTTKQGFTFAELMISLVVIAVITLILYPTISDLAPNNNEYLFKSAYKTIEMVTSDIMNSPNLSAMPQTQTGLCQAFCDKLNVVKANGSANTCTSCTAFTTSNGMRWAFANGGNILIDVNASNNKSDGTWFNGHGFNADPWQTGANQNHGINITNDSVTMDTFSFTISPQGKITINDTVGQQHMQDPGNE